MSSPPFSPSSFTFILRGLSPLSWIKQDAEQKFSRVTKKKKRLLFLMELNVWECTLVNIMVHRTNLGISGQILGLLLEWLFLEEWKNGSMGVTYEGDDYKAPLGPPTHFSECTGSPATTTALCNFPPQIDLNWWPEGEKLCITWLHFLTIPFFSWKDTFRTQCQFISAILDIK